MPVLHCAIPSDPQGLEHLPLVIQEAALHLEVESIVGSGGSQNRIHRDPNICYYKYKGLGYVTSVRVK